MRSLFKYAYIALVLANLFDVLTSVVCYTHRCGVELNPLANTMGFWPFITVKLVSGFIFPLVLYFFFSYVGRYLADSVRNVLWFVLSFLLLLPASIYAYWSVRNLLLMRG